MSKYTIEIKWACAFILMSLAWMASEKIMGLHSTHIDKHAVFTNFIAVPAIALYVLALYDKRKNYYGGYITYGQGFRSGLIITVIVTLLSPLVQYITSTYITPGYFPNVIRYVTETGKMTQQEAESYFNLKSYIIQGLIGTPVMGLATTAVVALFTRKVKPA